MDAETLDTIVANQELKIVTGCENLVFKQRRDEELLNQAGKIFCPTELSGVMGYLTAVEEYLCDQAGVDFQVETMLFAAKELEAIGLRARQPSRCAI